ncbi:TonB-dependent receptor [Parasphingopyxis sp. GrpM-11]|uniref:TonB-dependent receptor n=2 Tax=Parasphingopyxis marina TaxID=2761622 RepID=A0A842HQU6_9SPHN|nr:TonB-dependent receptor [Parasphingopyxis marina]
MLSTPAFAQDELAEASASQPAIVVTGSRITNPNLEQSSPIQVVGQDEIDLRQATNAEELIGELPGIAPGINNSVNNGSGGIATLNLRNLGSTRNLILLDGQRLVPASLASQTDLNIIPVALIERVEVVTGGASSVYGADAITGVANFITRRDFEGVEAAVTYGITERGDGERLRGDVTIGANFADGRGNAVLSIGYQQVDDVLQSNRLISQNAIFVNGAAVGSGTAVPTRVTSSLDGGLTSGTNQLNPTGDAFIPTYTTFNYNPFNFFQTPLERYNIYGSARYEITPGIEAYTRAMFTKTTVELRLAPSGLFGDTWQLPLNNPFLTDAMRTQICNAGTTAGQFAGGAAECIAAGAATDSNDPLYREAAVTINRRLVEMGPRNNTIITNQFQVWTGLRGDLTDTLSYDVSASYGESQRTNTRTGWGLKSRVQNALRALDANNCEDASNGCFPVNLFGGGIGQNIDPRAVAYFNQPAAFTDSTSLAVVSAFLAGELGESGFFTETPVGFSLGAEYREYNASRVSDISAGTQDEVLGTGAPSPTFSGSYDVIEGYAELIVPILEDIPGFYSLTAEGGIRVSDYSNSGTSVTWKAGGSWEPFQGFRIRGIYQHSVRSPNIGELFAPVTTGLTALTVDPCAGPGPFSAALTSICIAQGAPAGTIGGIPVPSAAQVNATGGGNPNLDVEKADSFTLGVIVTPPQVPGLAVTVDYYNIEVTDAITTLNPGDVLTPCFGPNLSAPTPNPAAPECALIQRNPLNGSLNGGGDTPGLILQLTNAGTLETSGIDFRVNYSLPVSFGSVNFDLNGNWTEKLVILGRECVGLYSNNCEPITPEWAFNFRTTLSIDDLVDVSLLWRWTDGVEYEFAATTTGILPEYLAIDDASYFDLSVRSNVSENFDVTFSVNNLLDRDAPNVSGFIGSSTYNSGNTYPTTYDVLGRTYSVTGRVRF